MHLQNAGHQTGKLKWPLLALLFMKKSKSNLIFDLKTSVDLILGISDGTAISRVWVHATEICMLFAPRARVVSQYSGLASLFQLGGEIDDTTQVYSLVQSCYLQERTQNLCV